METHPIKCFAHENPFRLESVTSDRYRFIGSRFNELLQQLERQNGRGSIIGNYGSGKTTLLREFRAYWLKKEKKVEWLTIWEDKRLSWAELLKLCSGLMDKDVLIVDGADYLTMFQWWFLLGKGRFLKAVLISVHQPQKLPTLHKCETTPELLHDLIRRRCVGLPARFSNELFRRHKGNMRDAFAEIYDRFAEQ